MDSIVYDFLRENYHEKEFELYLSIGNLIEHFELEENYQLLTDVVYNEDMDAHGKHDNVANFFMSIMQDLVKQFGITLSVDTKLSEYVKVVESLLYLEQTEHFHSVIDTINNLSDDNEECLCVLLSLVSTEHEAFYQPLIERVESSLLERIYEKMVRYCDEEEVELMEEPAEAKRIQSNIRKMLKLYNPNGDFSGLKCLELISVIDTTEMNFERLYGIMNDYIYDDDPEKTALSLYTLAISATDTCEKPLFFLQGELSKNYPMDTDLYQTLVPLFRRIHDGFERTNV